MKVLITGISGLFGLNAALVLRSQCHVTGTYLEHPVHAEGVDVIRLNLQDRDAAASYIANSSPDLIIHAAGLTNVDACESAPVLARALNVDAAVTVAAAARAVSARLIHISTDHLFDGNSPFRSEDDAPEPLNVYGRTKLEAENLVMAEHPDALVVRTNFYGWGHPTRQSFSDWILAALRGGRPVTMFHDVYFSPMLVNDLIDALMELARQPVTGVINVAGSQRISKYAFSCIAAREFGLDEGLLEPVSVEVFGFRARRPRDMSLDIRRVVGLVGHPMPDVRQGLERLRELETRGVAQDLRRAMDA